MKYHNQDCRFNGICLGDNLYTKKKFIKEQAKGLKTYVCNVPMLAYTFWLLIYKWSEYCLKCKK